MLVLSDKLCCQGPLNAGMRRTLLALPWLGVLSGREAWDWEGGQANLVKLAAWGRLIGGGETGGGEAI